MSTATAPLNNAIPPPGSVSHADKRVAIQTIFIFWAFYFVLNTAHMAISGTQNQLEMMCRRAVVVVIGITLTSVMYAILWRLESRSMRFMVVATFLVSAPISIIYATVNYMAFYVAVPTEAMMREVAQLHASHEGAVATIADLGASWYFFVAAWGILYVALSYAARVGHAERRAAVYRSEAQAAQLRALRYQINPHFLFNTLNSLSALVLRQRTSEAEKMITNLATFFRTTLTSDPAADIPLSDEIDMQRLYLDIERIRFPERLSIVIDVPKTLENVPVPGMILQPLVENAIKHGVARTNRPVTLSIRAQAEGDLVHLTVEDDAESCAPSDPGQGVGLRNVRDRLVARFDGAANVQYGRRDAGGFRVELTIPTQTHA
ncbi:MAG TPA: histidine kinase [Rhizomicrobium sp.]|nr:histidine kinase [Rhizomicrobium sp.]